MCALAYLCMRKLFAPHAAGPVVCLKSAMETAGLGFQPVLQPHCVSPSCDCNRGHSCVTCQTKSGGGAVSHLTTQSGQLLLSSAV